MTPALDHPGRIRTPPADAGEATEDRCPGVLALHPAEDGWLARIRLPGGRLSAPQLETVGRLARRGNGIVEVTRRANVQVRGLREDAGPEAARMLAEAGLLPSLSHERVRNVLASPFGGRGDDALLPTDDVVDALDRALCADPRLAMLPRRFQFGVDDGTGLILDQGLDVGLAVAGGTAGEPLLDLWLDGRRTTARLAGGAAIEAALDAARAFLDLRREQAGSAWRVRSLPGGAAAIAARLGLALEPPPASPAGAPMPAPGVRPQRDGLLALTVLPPLARIEPPALAALAKAAGGGDVRLSPWKTLTLVDVAPRRRRAVTDALAGAGLATEPSGFAGLSACAGLGACSKALVDVRAAAGRRAARRRGGAPLEHWSACERRCGEPREAGVRVAATSGERVLLERDGVTTEVSVEDALALLDEGALRG